LRDDLRLCVYFETANASHWLKNGSEQSSKRGQNRSGTAKNQDIFTKYLEHQGTGKHFAKALFVIERTDTFPGYGAVKICLLR
jgi:hypothetical protein